jgi:hypothetical protein
MVDFVDPDEQLPSGIFSLTKYNISIQDSLRILIEQGMGRDIEGGIYGCAPIEGTMWLHMVALQYLAITQRPEFPENQERGSSNFRTWYGNVLNTNDNVLVMRKQARDAAKTALDVLGKDTMKYSIDFDNGELVKLGQRRPADQEIYNDIRFEAGWLNRVFNL